MIRRIDIAQRTFRTFSKHSEVQLDTKSPGGLITHRALLLADAPGAFVD